MTPQTTTAKVPARRKAGGTGKKGKQFVEDKSQLLSLVAGITDNTAAVSKAKVEKVRSRVRAEGTTVSASGVTKGKAGGARAGIVGGQTARKSAAGEKKREDRAKALEDAKSAIMEKRRERKARRVERKNGEQDAAKSPKTKKTVGFA